MRVDEYMGRHGRCAGVSMIDVNIIQQQQTASVVYSARPITTVTDPWHTSLAFP